jgi:putative aldouronate transport system permease protein
MKAKPSGKLTAKRMKQYSFIYVMLLPVIVYFIIFTIYPLGLGVRDSLHQVRILGDSVFIGFDNYTRVLGDRNFYQSIVNAIIIGGVGLLANIAVGGILAIMINELSRKIFKRIFQTATYLPFLFSWAVVGGIWISILSNNGLLNTILGGFDIDSVRFLTTPAFARPIMILTNVWKNCGYYVVLILAGVVSIDDSIYESAQIDGASRIRQITGIMIPNLVPTFKVLLLLGAINLLRTFDQIIIMENPTIVEQVRVVLVYIYNLGFGATTGIDIGRASAAASMVLLVTAIITILIRRITKYEKNY